MTNEPYAALVCRLMVSTPIIHVLIYRPRRDGRLSWPGSLTHSGHFTHEVVTSTMDQGKSADNVKCAWNNYCDIVSHLNVNLL